MNDPNKNIALVTGGNRGIGLELCLQLAQAGMHVILTARDATKGIAAATLLQKQALSVSFYPLDVTDLTSIRQVAAHVHEQWGRLDLLVNNAAVFLRDAGAASVPTPQLRKSMEINFFGPVQLTQTLIPCLKKSKAARIINISSGMGAMNEMRGGDAGYRISKTALNAFTAILAADLADTNIQVNSVCPGWVKTDMGGPGAPREIKTAVSNIVWLAMAAHVPNGKFLRDRKVIDW